MQGELYEVCEIGEQFYFWVFPLRWTCKSLCKNFRCDLKVSSWLPLAEIVKPFWGGIIAPQSPFQHFFSGAWGPRLWFSSSVKWFSKSRTIEIFQGNQGIPGSSWILLLFLWMHAVAAVVEVWWPLTMLEAPLCPQALAFETKSLRWQEWLTRNSPVQYGSPPSLTTTSRKWWNFVPCKSAGEWRY